MRKMKYFVINNKRLAEALAYLSHTYMIFDDREVYGRKIYSFEDSEELRDDIKSINNLRIKRNNFNK